MIRWLEDGNEILIILEENLRGRKAKKDQA